MEKFLTLKTAATLEPVAASDALAFLRADESDLERVAGCVAVAREVVENFTGRALMSQTWTYTADGWPAWAGAQCVRGRTITLEKSPLASVTSVKYWPLVGSVQQTLSSALYIVQTGVEPGRIVLNYGETWPDLAERPDAVQIEFVAGYASAALVPATLKHAVQLLTQNFYDQRAPMNIGNIVNELPYNLKHLLESRRVGGWSA